MNCTIDALIDMKNIGEPAIGGHNKDKMSAFAKFLDRVAGSPKAALLKPAPDKTSRIQPIRKMAVSKRETETDMKAESAETQAEAPVLTDNIQKPDKEVNIEDNRTLPDINHKIVQTLSEMLLVPPEQILTAMVDMNIQPVMLREQTIMEEFVSRLQAVSPVRPDIGVLPRNAAEPDIPLSNALPEQGVELTPVNPSEIGVGNETKIQAGNQNIEQLAAAVTQIIRQGSGNKAATPDRAETPSMAETSEMAEIPDTEDVWTPESPPAAPPAEVTEIESPDAGADEDIGESWHSSKSDNDITLNGQMGKPDLDNRQFALRQTETLAAPVNDNVTDTGGIIRQEAAKNVDVYQIIRQIKDGIQAETLGGGVSELKLTLKPESLGEVSLRLLSDNGIVTARFTAENQRVKEIMESNFNSLRDNLNGQGINVSQLSVSVGQQDARERRFASQTRRMPSRIEQFNDSLPELLPPLAAHDSRVSYTA